MFTTGTRVRITESSRWREGATGAIGSSELHYWWSSNEGGGGRTWPVVFDAPEKDLVDGAMFERADVEDHSLVVLAE